jgi:hypothetical protein
MIHHLEPIDIAMVKAIEDGSQTQIYKFVEIPEKDLMLECITRTHRVNIALMEHKKYQEVKNKT